MFCPHCGAQVSDEAYVCPNCGFLVDGIKGKSQQKNVIAIAGFICSFFSPLLGWIFGGIGLSRADKRNVKGWGWSVAAIIIATITFIFNLDSL